jgi:hypothetical protein
MAEAQSSLSSLPFGLGAIVLVTLNNPREKYWGAIVAVTPAGVALRGVDLNSFEDFVRQMNQGDEVAPHMVFFPMHRVERMELDTRNGEIPAMQERFENKTGRSCAQLFAT